MMDIYLICAVVGGTLIVCQFLLTLLGLGGDHDMGGHDASFDGHLDVAGHDSAAGAHHVEHGSWFFTLLTFRTLSAAVAFFGLAGSAARPHFDPVPTLGLALLAGALALFVVAWLMRFLSKLNVDGTARIDRTVGSRGTVYLSVPGSRGGVGKVLVNVLNRSLEYKAVTAKEELPTGAKIVVVSVVSADTVEVAPIIEAERTTHA